MSSEKDATNPFQMRSEVQDALRTQPAEAGVTVKALEWRRTEHDNLIADAGLATYFVSVAKSDGRFLAKRNHPADEFFGPFYTEDEGVAAAQADYEARIRSALVPTPAPQGVGTAGLGPLLDRFERAAMAYERLGKLTKDDEKTRAIRKDTIAELGTARRAILAAYPHMTGGAQGAVAWRYRYNGRWYVCDSEEFAQKGLDAHPLYTTPQPAPSSADAGMLAALKAVRAEFKTEDGGIGFASDALPRIIELLDTTIVASASPVQPEAEGWKTMDSAPKDGTRVLVYEIGRPVEVAHYNPKSWQWSNRYRPVRWRPLPAAPKQGGE